MVSRGSCEEGSEPLEMQICISSEPDFTKKVRVRAEPESEAKPEQRGSGLTISGKLCSEGQRGVFKRFTKL